jgi:hypothetical protein
VSAIEKYFFTPLYYPRSVWSVIRWWESRRPIYNLAVGASGLLTLGAVALLEPGSPFLFLGGALVYGVMANVCYSLGPVGDLVLRRFLGDPAGAAGPALFRYGFAFSIGLTLLPIPLALLNRLVRLLF